MKTRFILLIVIVLAHSERVLAQNRPGIEITNGVSVYLPESEVPYSNRGALKLKLNDGLGAQTLSMDQYDVQTSMEGDFNGILYIQDQGGCVNLAREGITTANYLKTETIAMRNARQTHASGEIAFGVVGIDGTRQSGSENWIASYNNVTKRYDIAIEDEFYYYGNYTTIITPHSIDGPVIATTGSASDKLIVYLYTLGGVPVANSFSFVVSKHQHVNYEPACGGMIMLDENTGKPVQRK